MKKVVILFVAVFCIKSLAFSQEQLKYFEEDNTYYLGNTRLSENEVRRTLSSNISALDAWERGNNFKTANTGMKVATGVLITTGGVVTIVSFFIAMTEISVAITLAPLSAISNTPLPSYNTSDAWLTAGLILLGAGVITGIMIPVTKSHYRDYYSDAAYLYNKGLQKPTVSLHIGTTGNGLGFSLKF